ncbi:MAG: class I SAM-dependent DNA methyltransferase, partial [Alphaproteobacteria bacterium]
RELRQLELNVLKALYGDQADQRLLLVEDLDSKIKVNIHQMHGIEIEEFPAEIAKAALYLVDHQMNRKVSAAFGVFYVHLPLPTAANIVHGNALTIDWQNILPPQECTYIIGNPPFIGDTYQSPEQKQDKDRILKPYIKNYKGLDYVTCWHVKAAQYIKNTPIEVALVSTNSICQGEQVDALWGYLMGRAGVKINFAHQSFKWSNEATGNAQVMCIIIGFALFERSEKYTFTYADVRGEPTVQVAKNINPYLIDAPDIWVTRQRRAICNIPLMVKGNMPYDSGNYLFSEEEKDAFLQQEPKATPYIKKFVGAREFINNIPRYCLWLLDVPPSELRSMPYVMQRIEAVRNFRLNSSDIGGRKLAERPTQFREMNNPKSYLLIPSVSSERREYMPIGYLDKDTIASNLVFIVPNATLYEFGVMTSNMHMAWMRITAGRLETRYRYSKDLNYNTFPWPNPTKAQKDKIMACAQAVLDARAEYPDETYADLYDATLMPPDLRKAHKNLDKAVEAAYRKAPFADDNARIAYLFNEYAKLTADMLTQKPKRRKKTK